MARWRNWSCFFLFSHYTIRISLLLTQWSQMGLDTRKKCLLILSWSYKKFQRWMFLHHSQEHGQLDERCLVGWLMEISPSLHYVKLWVEKIWKTMIKGYVTSTFLKKCIFTLIFKNKDDQDLIIQSVPYFIRVQGLYFN